MAGPRRLHTCTDVGSGSPTRLNVALPPATLCSIPTREAKIVREFSVPASFSVGEHDNVASAVFDHERDDPNHVIVQRLVDGSWTDVTCREVAVQVRSTALGLIALGVQAGDRVAVL